MDRKEYYKKWRQENIERLREYDKKRRQINAEKIKEYRKKLRQENPERSNEITNKWRKGNPEKYEADAIKQYLKDNRGITDPPPELIEAIKQRRILKRTLKQIKEAITQNEPDSANI